MRLGGSALWRSSLLPSRLDMFMSMFQRDFLFLSCKRFCNPAPLRKWLLAGFTSLGFLLEMLAPAAWAQSKDAKAPSQAAKLVIDRSARSVSFDAEVQAGHFTSLLSFPKHHHLIVWKGGRATGKALFVAEANDLEIQRALESLGGQAGNNLTLDSWERRSDFSNPDPDRTVQGSLVEVTVSWPGHKPVSVREFLDDRGKRGFVFRLGGHEGLIPVWKSGCVVCLESCPGGRISNERYTLRDHFRGTAEFPLRPGVLPPDGTRVRVTLTLR